MPLPDDLRSALDHLAAAQAGHVARWQVLALGLSTGVAASLPGRLGWTSVGDGVWRLPGHRPSPVGLVWAALLATMNLVVATGPPRPTGRTPQEVLHLSRTTFGATAFTGAGLHELVPNLPTRAQLLIPHELVRRLEDVRTIRTRVYPDHLELVEGVPVVPALRVLWDCAWVLRTEQDAPARLRALMTRADGLRLIEAEHLHQVVTDPRAHGLPSQVPEPFRIAALSLTRGHSHSGTEHLARRLITEVASPYGLHVEPRPTDIGANGIKAGEADIAIPLLRLDFEIDGLHHREPRQRAKDRRRDGRFRAIDWIVRRHDVEVVDEDQAAFKDHVEADILEVAAIRGITLTRRTEG